MHGISNYSFSLRQWEKEDARAVAEAANNEKIAQNLRNAFPYPYTLADAEWYVNDCIVHGEEHQITRAIVVDGKVVGSIGVFVKYDVYEKSGELGYWLAEDCWGKGIMRNGVYKNGTVYSYCMYSLLREEVL